jgi:phage I-like protein
MVHAMPGKHLTAILDSVALQAVDGKPPTEIMLWPAGASIRTVDGRGPYKVADAVALAAASLQAAGGPLPIDECHATDLAAPRGEPAPARGWIVGIEAHADGSIWGKAEWTPSGAALMADRAYRYISPVIHHSADNQVLSILRASLINRPNLRGMAALHQESNMDFLAKLRAALGLKDDATEEITLTAVKDLKTSTALQSALAPIAKAAGLKDDADATAILGAVTTLAAGKTDATTITALQAELTTVTTKLNTLQADGAKKTATAYVDGEIAKGRVGVKPLREHYIAMHAVDAARVEKEIGAMPILGASGALVTPPEELKDGKVALNADQARIAELVGVPKDAVAKKLASERAA